MFELQYILIGVVQGITEFLPISSSAHLVIISSISDWDDQGIFTDIAVHAGTLIAVIIYLSTQIKKIIIDFFFIKKNYFKKSNYLAIKIILATLPSILIGFLFMNIFYNI